jgi:hypothetical protein
MTKKFDTVPRPFPLGGPQALGGPTIGPSGPQVIDFLPWVFPPSGFVPFDVVDVQTVNFGTTVLIPILDSQSFNAVIRWFGNETTIATAIPDIRWTILISGVGYQPYVNMQLTRGFVDNPDPIIIKVPQNRLIEVAVQNISGASNWEVRTRVKGWLY